MAANKPARTNKNPSKVSPNDEQRIARQFKNTVRQKKLEQEASEEESFDDEIIDEEEGGLTPSPGIAQSAPGFSKDERTGFERMGPPKTASSEIKKQAASDNAERLKSMGIDVGETTNPPVSEDSTPAGSDSSEESSHTKDPEQDPDVQPKAPDLAKDMAGEGKTANKKKAEEKKKKDDFKSGGGKVDTSQYDKPKGKVGAAAQKTANAAKQTAAAAKASADAVKRQVDSAKRAAAKTKAAITAPARKAAAAKAAVKQFMDNLNPLKKLSEMAQNLKRAIPLLIRMILTAKGLGTLIAQMDKVFKKENVDKCLTCGCCCACAVNCLGPCLLPIFIFVGVLAVVGLAVS